MCVFVCVCSCVYVHVCSWLLVCLCVGGGGYVVRPRRVHVHVPTCIAVFTALLHEHCFHTFCFTFQWVVLSTGCECSQTSLIRSSFIRIPRHPEENHWLPINSICHAYMQYVCSIIRFPRLSGCCCGKRMCTVMRGLTVHAMEVADSCPPYGSQPFFLTSHVP